MLYYAFEAIVVGLFINLLWKFILSDHFGEFGYFEIVATYWIIKMLFFNVFKLISTIPIENPENTEE